MRPAIMVAEPEPLDALSTRKLVLESAKFNVLTVHSTSEALECINTFPHIAAAVLVTEDGLRTEQIAAAVKQKLPQVPVVALSPLEAFTLRGADYTLSSHKPEQLLGLMQELFGDPRKIDSAERKLR